MNNDQQAPSGITDEASMICGPNPGFIPATAPSSVVESATMDNAGNVRMQFRQTPDDRAMTRRAAQDMGRQHASMLASPIGLRGLFPSNKTRLVVKKRKA
jgi:hypothetical protein